MDRPGKKNRGSSRLRKLRFYSLPVMVLPFRLYMIIEKDKEMKMDENGVSVPGWRKLCPFPCISFLRFLSNLQ